MGEPNAKKEIPGYWVPTNVTVPYPPGSNVLVQVRVWDSKGGTITNFEAAETAGASFAISRVIHLVLALPTIPPTNVNYLRGLESAGVVPTLTVTRGASQIWPDAMPVPSGQQFSNQCGVLVGTNRWFRFGSSSPGEVVINTDGSSIPTVLTVYTGSIIDPAPIVCSKDLANTNDSTHTNDIEVRFNAETNQLYQLSVGGQDGASGRFRLNYSLPTPLEARLAANMIELSWPADATDFSLQASTTLSTNSWRAITNLASVGTNRLQLGTASVPRTFYRLGPP